MGRLEDRLGVRNETWCNKAVQRALNWAVKLGHLEKSPVAHIEKPPADTGELLILPSVYEKMLALNAHQAVQDLLTFAWDSGARPQEVFALEARHVDLQNSRIVFPASEAKGKRDIRIIHLTDTAQKIVARLAAQQPEGKLLRNTDGLPWRRSATSCLFGRLKKKLGVKYCLYNFRHTFCHRAPKNGVDSVTVANLMGHRDVAMVARVYSNLSQDQAFLSRAMRSADG